jgi:hypothetical protein
MVHDEKEHPAIPSVWLHHKWSQFHNKSISGVNTGRCLPIPEGQSAWVKIRLHSDAQKSSQIGCIAALRLSIFSHPHQLYLHSGCAELRSHLKCTVPASPADSSLYGPGHGCGSWNGPGKYEYFHVLKHRLLSGNKGWVKQMLPGTLAVFYLHYWWCYLCPPPKYLK